MIKRSHDKIQTPGNEHVSRAGEEMVSKFRREARLDWKDDTVRGAIRGGDQQDHHLWRLKVREVPSITPCARSTSRSLVFEELFFKSEA